MSQGTVTWFSADKGSGFVVPDDVTPRVFVHAIAIDGGRSLQDDQ
jgi:cold shock CspA family protein